MKDGTEALPGLRDREEYVILPVQTMDFLMSLGGQTREIYLPGESIFPSGYVEYLEKVLNSNRHLPPFVYGYVREDPIGSRGIWQIARCQIAGMRIGNKRCFQSVTCVEKDNEVVGIVLNSEK